ncbi:long polar fimbrial protein LpfA [Escherichia sp. E2748]|nr:long polar fimbrial major subunit LpfA [Escherichia sp. E2748]TGB90767.1 long polar fimbrial protein LpfA [Escherichia sp. E2748]
MSVLALTSGSVFAAESGDGTVKFIGEIVDAPCVLSVDSQKQEVVLGQVNKSVFTAIGAKSPSKPFEVKLEECDTGAGKTKVKVGFSGVGDSDSTNGSLVSLSTEAGAATGVGIGIYDNSNTLIPLNSGTAETEIKDGQTVLYFTANYVSTKDVVTTGYGNAEVDFNLTYE